jgi:hypothetical protein
MVDSQFNCEQVWREISNYIEGEVDPSLRSAMDEHFRTCKRCASVLEGTRNVIRLYSDERMMEVPAGFGRRLEKRLAQDARASRSRWLGWSTWLVPVAALALITAGVWLTNSWITARREHSQQAAIERNIPPDMKVVVSDGAKLFHVAGCGYIENKDKVRTLTAKEAIREGYTPCLRCLRKYIDGSAVGRAPSGSGIDATGDADSDADLDVQKPQGGQ